jgi:hypothetical protein
MKNNQKCCVTHICDSHETEFLEHSKLSLLSALKEEFPLDINKQLDTAAKIAAFCRYKSESAVNALKKIDDLLHEDDHGNAYWY